MCTFDRGTLCAIALFLVASPAAASREFPEVLKGELGLVEAPHCVLCHATEKGGRNTVVTPFGISMRQLGTQAANVGSFRSALRESEARKVDSDGDGVSDLNELRMGRNPNVPDIPDGGEAGPVIARNFASPKLPPPLQTGCSVTRSRPAGDLTTLLAGACVLAAIVRRGPIDTGRASGPAKQLATWAAAMALLAGLLLGGFTLLLARTQPPGVYAAPGEASAAAPLSASASAFPPGTIGVRHVLVQYKGAWRAQPSVTFDAAEAKARAEEARVKLAGGENFALVVEEYSNCPETEKDGGMLPPMNHGDGMPQVRDAAFSLDVGGVSKVVETPFGFHVLQRVR